LPSTVQRSTDAGAARFDVRDEMGRGVGTQVGIRLAGRRPAAPAPALVEEHGTIGMRIEEASLARRGA